MSVLRQTGNVIITCSFKKVGLSLIERFKNLQDKSDGENQHSTFERAKKAWALFFISLFSPLEHMVN